VGWSYLQAVRYGVMKRAHKLWCAGHASERYIIATATRNVTPTSLLFMHWQSQFQCDGDYMSSQPQRLHRLVRFYWLKPKQIWAIN